MIARDISATIEFIIAVHANLDEDKRIHVRIRVLIE